jgi:hypothetical protein
MDTEGNKTRGTKSENRRVHPLVEGLFGDSKSRESGKRKLLESARKTADIAKALQAQLARIGTLETKLAFGDAFHARQGFLPRFL